MSGPTDGGRKVRLGAAIQAELAQIIGQELKDPRVHAAGLITITRVDLAPDLRLAKVYVSFTGTNELAAAAIEGLSRSVGFVRGEVARRLSMRRAPDLRFFHDRTAEHVAKIDALLKGDS